MQLPDERSQRSSDAQSTSAVQPSHSPPDELQSASTTMSVR